LLKYDFEKEHKVESTDDQNRIKNLSFCGNKLLAEASNYDYVFWIESDILIYNDYLIERLLFSMKNTDGIGVVAPTIWLDTHRGTFYDVWGFQTLDREHWTNNPPYSHDYGLPGRLLEVNSVGSCCLIDCNLLKQDMNFGEGGIPELCKQAREEGFKIYVDRTLKVFHPSLFGYVENRWI